MTQRKVICKVKELDDFIARVRAIPPKPEEQRDLGLAEVKKVLSSAILEVYKLGYNTVETVDWIMSNLDGINLTEREIKFLCSAVYKEQGAKINSNKTTVKKGSAGNKTKQQDTDKRSNRKTEIALESDTKQKQQGDSNSDVEE